MYNDATAQCMTVPLIYRRVCWRMQTTYVMASCLSCENSRMRWVCASAGLSTSRQIGHTISRFPASASDEATDQRCCPICTHIAHYYNKYICINVMHSNDSSTIYD